MTGDNVRHIDFRRRPLKVEGGGHVAAAHILVAVSLTAEQAAMLDDVAKEGGFADLADCAQSIICAVLEDDAKLR